jgi:hypothetical protein
MSADLPMSGAAPRAQRFAPAARLRDVRRLIVALTLVLVACADSQSASQALAPASPSPTAQPSPTPLPSGVIDPKPLVQRVRGMTGIIRRIDDITTKLMSSTDYMGPGTVPGPTVSFPPTVWVVAVVGDIAPNFGLMARPNSQCGLFAFAADTGEGWSSSSGSLALCQPYFARSLTPPDAPLSCASNIYSNGVPPTYGFSKTRHGPFGFTSIRDDSWRQPTTVRGAFLANATEGTVMYEDAFCLNAFVRPGPAVEKLLASGVGAKVPTALPQPQQAIWLRGYHAVSGKADDAGHIDVVVEPKAGYEWAFFDWHALVPDGGYVMFRFSDGCGREILPWRLANGP